LFWRNNAGMMKRKYSVGLKGAPDVIGSVCGRFVGVEFKAGTKESPAQRHFAYEMGKVDGFVKTCKSVDDAIEWVRLLVASFYDGLERAFILDTLSRIARDNSPGRLAIAPKKRTARAMGALPSASVGTCPHSPADPWEGTVRLVGERTPPDNAQGHTPLVAGRKRAPRPTNSKPKTSA